MVVKEQADIINLLAASQRVLVVTKHNPSFDEVGSALAWFVWLKQQDKDRIGVVSDLTNKNRFKFLPGFSNLNDHVQSADSFIITMDVSKTKVKELSYDVLDEKLEIRIKPEDGHFSPRDVSFTESSFGYDVIITLGASELTSLGPVFEKNRELFFNTPIINIDRTSRNVRYGQINAVYLTATSLAEISYECMGRELTPEIATNLFTALIAATSSFQSPQVTPDTLHLASELIVAGAEREEIVSHLYRTKDMDKLKVWGRVLSRLSQMNGRVVYSDLKNEDVEGKDIDLTGLVDDLVLASPEADIVLFFFEASLEETIVYAYAKENYDVLQLLHRFNPQGSAKHAELHLKKSRAETEQEVLTHLKQQLRLINR